MTACAGWRSPRTVGSGVFALWNDYRAFQAVKIGDGGELVWSDAVDLCPDAMYIAGDGQESERRVPKPQAGGGECLKYAGSSEL